MSKQTRGDKGEKLVSELLISLPGFHLQFDNYTYLNPRSGISHQIDHIFIHKNGVFVIETKNYYGTIISNTGDVFWYKIINDKKTIISNPLIQNKSHLKLIEKLLNKECDVIQVVVFVKNNAPDIDDNVINANDLGLFIESYPYKKPLGKEEIEDIYKRLRLHSEKVDINKHVESVQKVKRVKDNRHERMRVVIETGRCPTCNTKVLVDGYSYKCPRCGFKFSLN